MREPIGNRQSKAATGLCPSIVFGVSMRVSNALI